MKITRKTRAPRSVKLRPIKPRIVRQSERMARSKIALRLLAVSDRLVKIANGVEYNKGGMELYVLAKELLVTVDTVMGWNK